MNTLGNIFKVHSFGESHGPCVGAILDGCPAGVELNIEDIQEAVNKRKTGQHTFSSARKEEDRIELLSGIFEGKTIGTPICILIRNHDARSKDYDKIKDVFRPGHADYTYQVKYGQRDYRGGGRSSIRITAPIVAAGAIANQIIKNITSIEVTSFVSQIGQAKYDISELAESGLSRETMKFLSSSSKNLPSSIFEQLVDQELEKAVATANTLGGRISTVIDALPPGLGEPIFGKLQTQLSTALMSINTVKAIEFGEGIGAAEMLGTDHNDEFMAKGDLITTRTNHHGGLLGGITTGQPVNFSVYFKPISSIQRKQKTVNEKGAEVEIEIDGRHDVCAVPRAVPIVEAYTKIVLVDLLLQNRYAKI